MTTGLVEEAILDALPDGTSLLSDQFTILGKLGNGGFGITYLANDNYLDRKVVIKECFPETFCRRVNTQVLVRSQSDAQKFRTIIEMFTREARSIAKMRHPNIIAVHRIFEDNGTAYIALDLIDGQDLLDIICEEQRKLTPSEVRNILFKLLDAVQTIHDQDLLHRDISPDNILLDKWSSPVLIDFGAAREQASRESRTLSTLLVVKDGYSPQEFYFAGGKQNPSSDLYALAATFYHVISGEAPPNSQTRMAEVATGNADPCQPLSGRFGDYDNTFLKAIDKAMRVLPKDRLQSAKEWQNMIKPKGKTAEPYKLPPIDNMLEKTLTRLVSETNEQLEKAPEPVDNDNKPARALQRSSALEWAQEFNEETVSRKSGSGRGTGMQHDANHAASGSFDGKYARSRRFSLKSIIRFAGYLLILAVVAMYGYTTLFAT